MKTSNRDEIARHSRVVNAPRERERARVRVRARERGFKLHATRGCRRRCRGQRTFDLVELELAVPGPGKPDFLLLLIYPAHVIARFRAYMIWCDMVITVRPVEVRNVLIHTLRTRMAVSLR